MKPPVYTHRPSRRRLPILGGIPRVRSASTRGEVSSIAYKRMVERKTRPALIPRSSHLIRYAVWVRFERAKRRGVRA